MDDGMVGDLDIDCERDGGMMEIVNMTNVMTWQ